MRKKNLYRICISSIVLLLVCGISVKKTSATGQVTSEREDLNIRGSDVAVASQRLSTSSDDLSCPDRKLGTVTCGTKGTVSKSPVSVELTVQNNDKAGSTSDTDSDMMITPSEHTSQNESTETVPSQVVHHDQSLPRNEAITVSSDISASEDKPVDHRTDETKCQEKIYTGNDDQLKSNDPIKNVLQNLNNGRSSSINKIVQKDSFSNKSELNNKSNGKASEAGTNVSTSTARDSVQVGKIVVSSDPVRVGVPVTIKPYSGESDHFNIYFIDSKGNQTLIGESVSDITWTFTSADHLNIKADAVKNGNVVDTFYRNLDVEPPIPVIDQVEISPSTPNGTLPIHCSLKFEIKAKSAQPISKYLFTGVRPDGKIFLIQASDKKSASWTPTRAGKYTFYFRAFNTKNEYALVKKVHQVTYIKPDVSIALNPTKDICVGKRMSYDIKASGYDENYSHRLYLVTSENRYIPLGTHPSGSYVFDKAGNYRFLVITTNKFGFRSMDERLISVSPTPFIATRYTQSLSNIYTYDKVFFTARNKGAVGNVKYFFILKFENGKSLTSYAGKSHVLGCTFPNPVKFNLLIFMKDSIGRSAYFLKPVSIKDSTPEISLSISNTNKVLAHHPNVYTAAITPHRPGSSYSTNLFIVRKNGTAFFIGQGTRVKHTLADSGQYRLLAVVKDDRGIVYKKMQKFEVVSKPFTIRSIYQSEQNIKTHQPVTFMATQSNGIGNIQYKYYVVYPSNRFKILSKGSNQSVTWTFLEAGKCIFVAALQDELGRTTKSTLSLSIHKGEYDQNTPVIYISPSNQPFNPYWDRSTTERDQMEAVAKLVYQKLQSYKVKAIMPDYAAETRLGWRYGDQDDAIRENGRPLLAKKMGANFYLAIHSNATGNGSMAYGPLALYNPAMPLSKTMAETLVSNMDKVTPFKNLNGGVRDGMAAFNGYGYAEIRNPGNYGIPAVLFEVNYHDNPQTGAWIKSHHDLIATSITNSIVQVLGLQSNSIPPSHLIVPANNNVPKTLTDASIIAAPRASMVQAEAWARKNNSADWFIEQLPVFWNLSTKVGIDPVITYAQAALETGYGRFNGVVDASRHNPCGLKTNIGGGDYDAEAHSRFDSWTTGIQAQVDHLALYAGVNGYPKRMPATFPAVIKIEPGYTPDPRHFAYLHGTAPTVKLLGAKWAPSSSYGKRIIDLMNAIRNITI